MDTPVVLSVQVMCDILSCIWLITAVMECVQSSQHATFDASMCKLYLKKFVDKYVALENIASYWCGRTGENHVSSIVLCWVVVKNEYYRYTVFLDIFVSVVNIKFLYEIPWKDWAIGLLICIECAICNE